MSAARVLWPLLFLCAWLVALLVRAPAAVVLNGGDPALAALLTLQGGTLWSGQAVLRPPLPPLTLSWRVSPGALWRGCLSAHVQFTGGSAPAGSTRIERCPFNDSVAVQDLNLRTAAADWLPALGLDLLQVDGTLHVQLASLSWDPGGIEGTGLASWRDAQLDVGRRVRLGTVAARIGAAQGQLGVEVGNGEGDLGLDLALQIDATGRYRLMGSLDPRGDADLQATLATAGDLGPDGRVSVRATGRLWR